MMLALKMQLIQNIFGLDTAAKNTQRTNLQLAPRLRPTCAGITVEGRVDFVMEEMWKPIVGYEGLYEVSSFGRIKALLAGNHGQHPAGRILKPQSNPNKYLCVTLYKDGLKALRKSVHTIVLEAFEGPRPTPKHVTRHLVKA